VNIGEFNSMRDHLKNFFDGFVLVFFVISGAFTLLLGLSLCWDGFTLHKLYGFLASALFFSFFLGKIKQAVIH
jgi:hypothetical protein